MALQMAQRLDRQCLLEPGRVFTPFDFMDLGSPHAIGMALLRMCRRGRLRQGRLRHLGRGLYDVPRTHPLLGDLLPTAEAIAQALARKDGATLGPTEGMAANLLRLSEQVPARAQFLTDGPARSVQVGAMSVELMPRSRRKVGSAAPTSSLVFAALRGLARTEVTRARVAHLRKALSAEDRERLIQDLPFAPAWMHPILRFIAGKEA